MLSETITTELSVMPDLRVNYVYMDAETRSRYDQVCVGLHWSSKDLVRQCIQAFFEVNQRFYVDCAYRDCAARAMELNDWYRTLRDGSEDDLRPYVSGRPAFGTTPLDTVAPVPTGAENKRLYNTLAMGGFNLVLLKTCKLVDLGPMSQVVSRIVKAHFDQYWLTNYEPQLRFDETCSLPSRSRLSNLGRMA